MPAKAKDVRIVMEGISDDFGQEISRWCPGGKIEGSGNLIVLTVPMSDLDTIREKLKNSSPDSLYQAVLPPTTDGKKKRKREIFFGDGFDRENAELAEAEGPLMRLSVLPSELAKSESNPKSRDH